jgi:predicted RNA-binding protein YlxR (DUF448 family)
MTKPKLATTKHVPMRTCIATGKKLPKKEMIRLVRLEDKDAAKIEIVVDPGGKLRGRGANIEMAVDSFDLAIKKGAIERALKLDARLKPEQIAQLRKDFSDAIEVRNFRPGNKRVAIKITRQELLEKLAS